MPAYKPFRDRYGRFVPRPAAKEAAEKPVAKEQAGIPFLKEREEFRKKVAKRSGECHYAIILSDGRVVEHVQDVCHARLRPYKDCKAIILDARQHYDELAAGEGYAVSPYFKGSEVVYREWMEWLVNDSPFASAFITKNFDEALEYGYVLDVSKGANLIYCAAIAMRTAHEFNYILSSWKDMEDWGLNPLTRFMLAHSLNKTGEVYTPVCRSGHHIVFSSANQVAILAATIKRGKMVDEGAPFNTDARRGACNTPFTGGENMYGEEDGSLIQELKALSKAIKGDFGGIINGIPVKDAKKILTPLINKLEGK